MIPGHLSHLDVDPRRKVPIPFSNVRFEQLGSNLGPADFTTIDTLKVLDCARNRLCGVCGKRIDEKLLCFLGGQKCVRSQSYVDPPMHERCARYAVLTCPYIAVPNMPRRKHGSTGSSPEGWYESRPAVFVLYCTDDYAWRLQNGMVLFTAQTSAWIEVLEETRSAA